MKRLVTLTAVIALSAGMAVAQDASTTFTPGADFMLNWDMDGDGQVTLAEATERRESIFYMFDLDGNGMYSPDELAGIDEHKALQAELGMGVGQGRNSGRANTQMQQGRQGQQGQMNTNGRGGKGGQAGGGRGRSQFTQQQQPGMMGQGMAGQQPGAMGQGMAGQQPGAMGQGMAGQQPGAMGQGMAGQQPGAMGQGMAGQQPGAMGQGMAGQQPGAMGQGMAQQPGVMGQQQPGARGQGRGAGRANLTDLSTIGSAQEILMFDADFNGTITMEEFLNGTSAWFAMRDRNVDGVITSADFGNGRF